MPSAVAQPQAQQPQTMIEPMKLPPSSGDPNPSPNNASAFKPPSNYNQIGLLEGATAALKTVARCKRGEMKNQLPLRDGTSPIFAEFSESPLLLSSDIYTETKNSWPTVWRLEGIAKVQPDIFVKDQKNGIGMKKSITDFRAHLKSISDDDEEDIWTAPDVPLMHHFSCMGTKKNRHCMGCSVFWKSTMSICEDLKPHGPTDMLKWEEEVNENFVGHLTVNNSYTPQKRETHALDTVNTLYYAEEASSSVLWGFISPHETLHLTAEDSIGVQLFDQRAFIDPAFLEDKVKVLYAIQKPGQTVLIPANWTYFNVRLGKGVAFSASWCLLRQKNIPDARRTVELNRAVGIYKPYNIGSIVFNSTEARLAELNSADSEKEKQANADFFFRILPVLQVLILEELLDERINLNSLSILAYQPIADQFRNGGIQLKGIAMHEVAHIRPQTSLITPLSSSAEYLTPKEGEEDHHSCALCKYVLFNSRRTCDVCANLDLCEVCHNLSSQMHPHKFKIYRKLPIDRLLDMVDAIQTFLKDCQPEALYKEPINLMQTINMNTDKPSRKRPHPDSSVMEGSKQNTHLLGAKEPLSNMPGQQPLPPGVDSYESEEVIDCVCANNKDLGFMISCEKCLAWLHGKCVGISKRNEPDEYYCPRCTLKLKNSAGTHRLTPRNVSPEERLKEYKLN